MAFFLCSRRVQCIVRWLVCLLLLGSLPASAAERELFWRELSVSARLDAQGELHVSELHRMVFSGEWNGGERTFRYSEDQKLSFESISRVYSDGTEAPLVRGDLTRKDGYDWSDAHTLRWRNRLPVEPPFDKTELVYRIQYRLSGILVATAEGGLGIDHQFAFTARPGIIERFRLHLDLDPVWQTTEALPIELTRGPLQPNEGVLVTLPLTRQVGAGDTPGVPGDVIDGVAAAPALHVEQVRPARDGSGDQPLVRLWVAAVFLCLVGLMIQRLLSWQRRVGHFAPLEPVSTIDGAWLAQHVLSLKPEVVGAAHDRKTGSAEVAALLARLEAENKIRSRVATGESRRGGNLELELLVERDQFIGYERQLVDKLFFSGKQTSTERIKKHYRAAGFDPASVLRGPLDSALDVLLQTPPDEHRGWYSCLLPALTLASVVGLDVIVFRMTHRPYGTDSAEGFAATLMLGSVLFLVVGVPLGSRFREELSEPRAAALWFLGWVGLGAVALACLLVMTPGLLVGTALVASLAGLLLVFQVLWVAWTREAPDALLLRKRLASARRYFRAQLAQPKPGLEDAWFPYLIALELGDDVDRWWRSFGAASLPVHPERERVGRFDASAGIVDTAAPQAWTGGGGRFGGGGASASWGAAAAHLGAGVAPPQNSAAGSSSSSSGSSFTASSGGGSSGGGGGGGW